MKYEDNKSNKKVIETWCDNDNLLGYFEKTKWLQYLARCCGYITGW